MGYNQNKLVTHLHTHSFYSFLEGIPSPEQLVHAASIFGMESLALTDHTCLTGAVDFYLACKAEKIKPILGLELDIEDSLKVSTPGLNRLVLLATDNIGWSNLCWLTSLLKGSKPSQENSLLKLSLLEDHSQGLICLTGGSGSHLDRLVNEANIDQAINYLNHLKEIFNDRIYVELQIANPGEEKTIYSLVQAARRCSLPAVATHNVYYLEKDHGNLQRTLTAIRLNVSRNTLSQKDMIPLDSSFISQEELEKRFSHLPNALATIQEIVDRCQLELPLGKPNFPKVPLPAGETALGVLREKALAGAIRLYGGLSSEMQARIDHELQVIGNRGYEPIFLITAELLDYARNADVIFSSRGSAASSLVAHCLGITNPDPLKLDLFFERFLNPARTTPPDIDTDLCSRRRDLVIQHVFDTYGADRVAMVGTINTFRPRSALSDVSKAFGLSPDEIRKLVNTLPFFFRRGVDDEENENSNSPFAELGENHRGQPYQDIFSHANSILGFPHHLSMHAGGVVISPGLMNDLVPTQSSGKPGLTITQFDLVSLEHMGLVKIDLLGIRGLTVLSDVADAIRLRVLPANSSRFELLESIPLVDPDTSNRLMSGQTIGCFQIESPGMRGTLKEIEARTIDDLIAALALYRPGPLKGGFRDAFIRRHKGLEDVVYLHPGLAGVLQDTHGVILYQEQVLRIAHELAGLSIADADLLRRAMSHFDPGKQMQLLKERFVFGSMEKSQVPREVAEQIWDLMAAFAGYGFPKAHAASYAMVAWRSAWCKTHFPAQFMAGVLANWGGYYSQRVYLTEARRMGLAIYPPNINYSQQEFTSILMNDKPTLYMGLDQVQDLTHRSQQMIVHERPFHSLNEFLMKVDPRPKEADNLIRAGALSDFGVIPDLLIAIKEKRWQSGQFSLFEESITSSKDWSLFEKVKAQKEILGIEVEAHPLELVRDQISSAGAITTIEVVENVGRRIKVAGTSLSWHRTFSSRGETMAYLILEDLEGMVDVIIPSAVYRVSKSALYETSPLLIEGIVEMSSSRLEPVIRAERVTKLSPGG